MIELEIGFGHSCVLFKLAKIYPDRKFIGVEKEIDCNAEYISMLEKNPNVKLIYDDIINVIPTIGNNSITRIHIYFPPPPRQLRYITLDFVSELYRILELGGIIKIITDDLDYYIEIQKNFDNNYWVFLPWESLPFRLQPDLLVGTKCEKIFSSKYFLECGKI